MTPKDKAIHLCGMFYQKLPLKRYVITTDGDLSWEYNSWKNVKECALICCDEVLGYMGADRGTEFWIEVKQEIEKL